MENLGKLAAPGILPGNGNGAADSQIGRNSSAQSGTPHAGSSTGQSLPHQLTAIAFDLDAASMVSLRQAFPAWAIEEIGEATAASLSRDWDPATADLLIVNAGADVSETLALCRLLVFCGRYSTDSQRGVPRSPEGVVPRADAPLLVLVHAGQENFVRAALEAGAASCLILPIHAKELVNMLAHAQDSNQPGRHTLNLDPAQREDRWRDDGGQG